MEPGVDKTRLMPQSLRAFPPPREKGLLRADGYLKDVDEDNRGCHNLLFLLLIKNGTTGSQPSSMPTPHPG
jgi:hypothetical protein